MDAQSYEIYLRVLQTFLTRVFYASGHVIFYLYIDTNEIPNYFSYIFLVTKGAIDHEVIATLIYSRVKIKISCFPVKTLLVFRW